MQCGHWVWKFSFWDMRWHAWWIQSTCQGWHSYA
nr:MAG TPA: hypothetical protein [Caudoviricetes sp.]DAY18526.1 MAG TPA: hypothetical protein [Caudoviricetes sp.]